MPEVGGHSASNDRSKKRSDKTLQRNPERISVFVLGLVRAAAHADRTAYRFGGITLAIVLLLPRPGPAWIIALHRFAEVSVGIVVVALLFASESDDSSEKPSNRSRDEDGVVAGNQRRSC